VGLGGRVPERGEVVPVLLHVRHPYGRRALSVQDHHLVPGKFGYAPDALEPELQPPLEVPLVLVHDDLAGRTEQVFERQLPGRCHRPVGKVRLDAEPLVAALESEALDRVFVTEEAGQDVTGILQPQVRRHEEESRERNGSADDRYA
jgi:DNA-binding helix-hairpin-helix protein with protein kinase domain